MDRQGLAADALEVCHAKGSLGMLVVLVHAIAGWVAGWLVQVVPVWVNTSWMVGVLIQGTIHGCAHPCWATALDLNLVL